MTSKPVREFVISYWYRTTTASFESFSIEDIIKIIIEYGQPIEKFVASTVHQQLIIENEGRILRDHKNSGSQLSGFGSFTAKPESKCHWRVKIVNDRTSTNIGIIEASKYAENKSTGWWWCKFGFSLFHNGKIYSSGVVREYQADTYHKGDIIDVWLDLKDNFDLSFGKNGKEYGKAFDVKHDTDYKLAVSLMRGVVLELVSFETN